MTNLEFGFKKIDTRDFSHDTGPWVSPPAGIELAESEIHVFSFGLDIARSHVARLERLLTKDEVDRAQRYRVPRARQRFIVSRVGLRELLAQYAAIDAACLRLRYGEFGKPYLENTPGDAHIQFNMSRSHNLSIVAIRLEEEVGVDVERVRPFPGALEIAERFFADEEYQSLRTLPVAAQDQAFLDYWTRKEAIVKSFGRGLSHPLSAFTVTLGPVASAEVRIQQGEHQITEMRSLYSLEPSPGYVAAVATRAWPNDAREPWAFHAADAG